MKKIVPALYSSYGRYIDEFRAIPNINDCLKPVERRALYSLHKTAQKLTKSAKVVGDIIGLYHPHGDGCLHGNTNIFDPLQYKFITFKEAYEHNLSIPVLCYDSENNKISIGIAHSFRVAKITNKYLHIKTLKSINNCLNSGDIYVTDNHPFLIDKLNEFIKLQDLDNKFDLCAVKLVNDRLTWSIDDYDDTLYNVNLNYSRNINFGSKLKPFAFTKEQINDDEEIKFYDFTVDKYENMLIPIFKDSKSIEFIIVHNSTYDTLVNLVNRGFAIGQGNFGYNAVKPVAPAAYRYCVTGDTLIPTDNGIYRIDQLEKLIDKVNICDIGTLSSAKRWINCGKDKVIKITTSCGYELIGNYNHPIVIKNPNQTANYDIWVKLKDVKLCNQCLIKRNYQYDTIYKSFLNPLELFIIGLIYNYKLNNVDILDNILLINIDDLDITDILPNCNSSIKDTKLYEVLFKTPYKLSNIESICKHSINLECKKRNIIRLLFYPYLMNEDGTLSAAVLKLSSLELTFLLSGIFIDNCYYLFDRENNFLMINLTLNNKKLLKQIQLILLYHFNIISCFKEKQDSSGEKIYCLLIDDYYSLTNFNKYLTKYLYFGDISVSDKINEHLKRTDKPNDDEAYIYDVISSIEYLKDEQNVYTLSMNSLTHSYVGNGFMNHNTEVKINPDLDRIAFELIKFAPYSDPELLNELQPDYIPCPVPIGLVGDGMINGISFNVSRIPRFNLFDLFNRLTNILQRQADPSINSLLILPNFPNFDIYEEAPGELEKLLTTGKGTLILKPHYKIDGKGIHVYGRPPLGCSGWLKEDTDDKKMKYACDDLSGRQGFEALFTPKNGARLNQDFINEVLSVIETKIHFICNVWDDVSGKVITQSIDELLLNAYNKWANCYKSKLEFTADKIRQQIREMIVIELIRYLLHNYSANIVTIDDVCQVYSDCIKNNLIPNNLSKDISDTEIITVCKKHSISKLFDYQINKQDQENNLKEITNDLNNFAVASFNFAGKLITNS